MTGSAGHRRAPSKLDLEELPPFVRRAVEDAIAGGSIILTRSGVGVGSLTFAPNVLEGTMIERPHEPFVAAWIPDGVTVVATTMKLSDAVRRRLSDEFGAAYLVLDIHTAPATTDVLLTHPLSPQLLGRLRLQFPDARIVVTEIADEELDVFFPGPVSRLLDAGASAYLPPRPLAEVAATVHAYLTQGEGPKIDSGHPMSTLLPAPQIET